MFGVKRAHEGACHILSGGRGRSDVNKYAFSQSFELGVPGFYERTVNASAVRFPFRTLQPAFTPGTKV
jgi:hypothetical protein